MTTTPTSGTADLRATFSEMLFDLPNTEPYTLFKAGFDAALAAGQATAAQPVVPAEWPTNEMIDAGRKAAASQGRLLGSGQSLWHVFRAMLAAAPAQPAAQQGAAYAEMTEKYYLAGGEVPTWDVDQMRAFADATHTLRASHGQALASKIEGLTAAQESLGVEFEKVLHDNLFDLYEESLQTASHGQAPAGATPECLTCSDHGAVGNILTAEPCPDCTRWNVQPAPAPQQAGEVRRAELVPGVMHCAKCKFQLNRVTLCVSDGNAYAGNNKTEPCPNGCGPLWPVTWEQEAKNCWKALEEMHERLMAAAAPQPSPTAQSADSVPAVSDLPPLPAPDLRDVGTNPQEIKEFLKGYATEYARTAIAASAPEGAEESRTIPDREIPGIVEKALQELEGLVKYATSTYGHWDMRRAKGALSDLEWWARRKLAAHAQAAECVTEPAGVVGPDGMMRDELRSMIEGMSVSVDVSTGDHDAGHRYFGTVTEVMECQGNKHGVTLLVQDAEPNFTATPTAPAQPAAQHGVAYAALPESFLEIPDVQDESGINAYYSREVVLECIDAARASHGQALRLLTQKEKYSLGRRADGISGDEWDQWVQEKFAQVNGLKVQGGSYEWDWE